MKQEDENAGIWTDDCTKCGKEFQYPRHSILPPVDEENKRICFDCAADRPPTEGVKK